LHEPDYVNEEVHLLAGAASNQVHLEARQTDLDLNRSALNIK
jgi:hypothetical protein